MDNKVVLAPPKLEVIDQCPRCLDGHGKTYITPQAQCKKCKLIYYPQAEKHLLHHYMYLINKRLEEQNSVTVEAELKYEMQIRELERMFQHMRNWDVQTITQTTSESKRVKCTNCGVCLDCSTCSNCSTVYHKASRCPKCGNIKSQKTVIKDIKYTTTKNKKSPACPHCGGNNIEFAWVNDSDTCTNCGSKKLTERRKYDVWQLTIKRFTAFELHKN